jgi:uncharacterized membrane protein YdbT with pleckstrin-like domain
MSHPEAGQPESPEETLFEGHPAVVPSLGVLLLAILTLGIWLLPSLWQARGLSYRITNHRIVIESGVLSKRMEQVDLYRVSDYTVERPLGQRLLGTGNLILQTFDKTTPELRIRGIRTDVVALYEALRQATERDRQKRGVRMVDYE